MVKLVPKTATRSEGCIKTLENMLTLARDGLLIGATERLKFRLLDHQDGNV